MTMALSPQDLHRIAQSRGWRDGRVEVFDTASGKVTVKGRARVRRKDEIIYEGKIQTLRRFQNEASEVREGQECGIVLDRFANFAEGDIIESYEIEKVAQEL